AAAAPNPRASPKAERLSRGESDRAPENCGGPHRANGRALPSSPARAVRSAEFQAGKGAYQAHGQARQIARRSYQIAAEFVSFANGINTVMPLAQLRNLLLQTAPFGLSMRAHDGLGTGQPRKDRTRDHPNRVGSPAWSHTERSLTV